MDHRTWVAGWALIAFAAGAQAQEPGGEDGCVVLGELVEAAVNAAAMHYDVNPAGLESAVRGARADRRGAVASTAIDRQVCGATVETVTRAFGRAMAALHLPLSWNVPPHPGHYCWSGDLRQCHPSADPTVPALPPDRLAFVYDAWSGVRRAVESRMPRGAGDRLSTFTTASLAEALSSNLRRSIHGPLYEAYAEGSIVRSR